MTNPGEPKEPSLDFDAFLVNANEQTATQDKNKLLKERIEQACDDALDLYEVPCVFRFDQEQMFANYHSFLESAYPVVRDSAHDAGVFDEEFITDQAIQRAVGQCDAEGVILTKMVMLIADYEKTQNKKKTTERKKEMMAILNVRYGMEPDSNWMHFAAEFLPGEPLDFSAAEKSIYLDRAIETSKAENRQGEAVVQAVQESIADIIIDGDVSDELQNQYFDAAFQIMRSIMKSDVEREAAIDECARQTGIPRDHLAAIRDAIDEAIRKTNGENE